MNGTAKRRQVIRRLVQAQAISTQAQIVRALRRQGIECTQASVSRDIAALGLVKAGGVWTIGKESAVANNLQKTLAGRIHRAVKAGDNLILLHTDPGVANIVGLALDGARWSTIAGTIAGDDTVLVACDGKTAQKKTLESLRALVPEAFA